VDDHRRYIVSENIERFEALLRSGQLDRGQINVVRALLAQARAEFATMEQGRGSEVPARVGLARQYPLRGAVPPAVLS
jgi:hypothetical protein